MSYNNKNEPEFLDNDLLTWDLIEVSKEEFQVRLDAVTTLECSMDTTAEDFMFQAHYTDEVGAYIGTMAANDDGTLYLVPEQVPENIDGN